jgi:hypothetical protein
MSGRIMSSTGRRIVLPDQGNRIKQNSGKQQHSHGDGLLASVPNKENVTG